MTKVYGIMSGGIKEALKMLDFDIKFNKGLFWTCVTIATVSLLAAGFLSETMLKKKAIRQGIA
jgi:hypothetical protein